MANGKFLTLENGRKKLKQGINATTGAPDANKIIRTGSDGKIDSSFIPDLDVNVIEASEALSAGDFCNIWNDGGTVKIRLADATNDRRAHGFVSAAVSSGANGTLLREGTNSNLSSLTVASRYYLNTVGGVTATAKTANGEIHQYLGTANSTTELNIEITDEIVLDF